LERGYAIVHLVGDAGGAIVRDAADAPEGTELVIALARGSIAARATAPRPE
ncbi:MAG: exodeoxyribonuclease VII large subunit, partial [Microbacteriaceae bacterium]|nr:exodeoxyribonuclease VII large subunit [Microbacteriaceae bacterium]